MVRIIWWFGVRWSEGIAMVDDGKLPRMTSAFASDDGVYCGAQSCGTFRGFLL